LLQLLGNTNDSDALILPKTYLGLSFVVTP